jgi:hypothetical protein
MGYKLLGWAVWNGARWYLRHRFAGKLPSRRVVAAGALGVAVAAAVVVARERSG